MWTTIFSPRREHKLVKILPTQLCPQIGFPKRSRKGVYTTDVRIAIQRDNVLAGQLAISRSCKPILMLANWGI